MGSGSRTSVLPCGGLQAHRPLEPLDLGCSLVLRQRMWLYGLDAPEARSKDPAEKAKGLESKPFVSQWFTKPGEVLMPTMKGEKHGRMLVDCFRAGEPSLCKELLERGLARPYNP